MKLHGALCALLSQAVVCGASSSGALVLVLQAKRPWISLLIASDTANCTDNNKETLSLENPRRNTIYSGYCMGCFSWPSISPSTSTEHTIPSLSIIASDELLEVPNEEGPKDNPITNEFDQELSSLPATAPQKNDVITPNTCEVVQEDETSESLLDSKPQSVKDDAVVCCPETYNEQELLLALLVISAKVKNDDQHEQRYDESIYVQQILLTMILVGVSANALFNNKQSKEEEGDVSNNNIAMKRNLSKQFNFEVDTEELEEEDDDEDGTPRASEPPITPMPNPLEQVLKDIFTLNLGDGKNKTFKKDKEKKNKKHKPRKRRSTIASCDSTDYIKGEKENVANPPALTDDTNESLLTKKVPLQKKKYGRGGKLIQVV